MLTPPTGIDKHPGHNPTVGRLNPSGEPLVNSGATYTMGHLIPRLIELDKPVNTYLTGRFWYGLSSTEKYEKLDHIDRLFEFKRLQ
jgi:hypothetical protein